MKDYLIVCYVSLAWSLYEFGFSWKALGVSMAVANIYAIIVLLMYFIKK